MKKMEYSWFSVIILHKHFETNLIKKLFTRCNRQVHVI